MRKRLVLAPLLGVRHAALGFLHFEKIEEAKK